jgi:hypothetical protein
VVRENNQTYRLGHTEQLKDGTRMGAGLPEKVLLFRKPPTDRSNGYADQPVAKPRPDYVDLRPRRVPMSASAKGRRDPCRCPGDRLQPRALAGRRPPPDALDGDRLVMPEEWPGSTAEVYRLWKAFNLSRVYDFEHHVRSASSWRKGRLPPDFMLLPPHSWHPDVWTDVMQMRSLNTIQRRRGRRSTCARCPSTSSTGLIVQFSQPGELVFDPFGGLGTVPYCALKLGRQGVGLS